MEILGMVCKECAEERKIEGTLTDVEIDPEFMELTVFKMRKKCD